MGGGGFVEVVAAGGRGGGFGVLGGGAGLAGLFGAGFARGVGGTVDGDGVDDHHRGDGRGTVAPCGKQSRHQQHEDAERGGGDHCLCHREARHGILVR